MIVECSQNVVTLLFKWLFLGALCSLIVLFGPSSFNKPLNFIEIIVMNRSSTRKVQSGINSLVNNFMNFADNEISLHLDGVGDVFIIDALMNLALHHRGPRVVLNIALPSALWHLEVLGETLLPKVLNCVIVRISHEVLEPNGLSVGFQSIHQSCSVTFYLFRGWNC